MRRGAGYAFRSSQASRSDGLTHDRYQVSPAHQEMKTCMADFIERLVVFDGEIPTIC